MSADHSEMLSIKQEGLCVLHISHFAKVHDNASMDSHEIRLQNLLCLIKEAGSKAELARLTGVNEDYLSQITSDKTPRNMGPGTARKLERGMRRPKGWMDQLHTERTPPSARLPLIWVPIITWEQAGRPEAAQDARDSAMTIPTIATQGGRRLSEKCFALRVIDDSMINPLGRPSYPPGCTIIVDPEREPKNADRVIVKIAGLEEPTFKVYTIDSGRVFLRSLNPQYPPLPWRDDMKVLGVVVQTVIDE